MIIHPVRCVQLPNAPTAFWWVVGVCPPCVARRPSAVCRCALRHRQNTDPRVLSFLFWFLACVLFFCSGSSLPCPATTPRPTASSPLFSQIASRWFDILPWQPEEANLDLARAIPPPPRARHDNPLNRPPPCSEALPRGFLGTSSHCGGAVSVYVKILDP